MPYKAHQEKNFYELGLESFKSRRWCRRLCCMFEIMKNQPTECLNNLILTRKQNCNSRNIYFPSYNCRTEYFKSSFFPASLEEWFQLDPSIRNSEIIKAYKQKLLPLIRPLENNIFNIFGPEVLELLTRFPANICLDEDVLNKKNIFALLIRLQKTSLRRL